MDTVLLNQILPAIVFCVFSIGFMGLWFNHRNFRSALAFACSYAFGALAFGIEAAWPVGHANAIRAAGDFSYIASAAIFPLAVAYRFGRPMPWSPVLLVAIVAMAGAFWYRYLDPSLAGRIQVISIAVAVLMGIAAFLIKANARRRIDRISFWLTASFAFLITLNTLIHNQYLATLMTVDNLRVSSFMAAVNLLVSVLSPAIAVSIFVSYGMVIIRKLENDSQRDHVTGLLNARGFAVRAAEMMVMCRSEARDLSVIIANIDNFTAVNRRFGVKISDQLMRDLAGVVTEHAGSEALCGRFEDGSLCTMIPDADEARSAQLAAHMHHQARRLGSLKPRSTAPALDEVKQPITITFGVGQLRPVESFDRLYSRTHAALYLGKQTGGDRVMRASGKPVADRLPSSNTNVGPIEEKQRPAFQTVSAASV